MTVRADITLAQLEALTAAANAGSLTAAAAELRTSQSNVSVAIANLERTLGVELLVRHRAKGVALTAVGRTVTQRGWEILEAVQALQERARGEQEGLEGELRIGSFLPLTPFYTPALLQELQERAPAVRLTIREATMDALQKGVQEGDLDLALVYDQVLPATLTFHRLARVRPYVIATPGTALAARRAVSLAELTASGETMITYDMPFTVERTEQLFATAGVPLPPEVRVMGLDSVRSLVGAGVGFSLLNQRWATDATADGGEVISVELSDDVEPLGLGIISRQARPNAKTMLAMDILRRQALQRHPPRGDGGWFRGTA